jgi:hypothetical protein
MGEKKQATTVLLIKNMLSEAELGDENEVMCVCVHVCM